MRRPILHWNGTSILNQGEALQKRQTQTRGGKKAAGLTGLSFSSGREADGIPMGPAAVGKALLIWPK